MTRGRQLLLLGLALALTIAAQAAGAQGRNPFSVGVSEGGGAPGGLTGWILAQQHAFDLMTRDAVRAVRTQGSALWTLLGVAFAYGVFHAAGPGHGKAVLAAYLVANERALRRGLALAALAALLQACVALALVGGFTLALGATSRAMRDAARWVEIASFAAIVAVGLALVWRKSRALWSELRAPRFAPLSAAVASRFACVEADAAGHVHGPQCGHFHMPDPATLSAGFSWRDAAGTVVAAGLRPCSGAILALVFAASQGIFYAGVAATFAMAAGTAVTTGAIAACAVYFRALAQRCAGGTSRRAALVARALEAAAALAVLLLGLGLLTGTLAGGF